MGDPQDAAQQPAPDPEQPEEDTPQQPPAEEGVEADNTWEGDKSREKGGIEPENTWEG